MASRPLHDPDYAVAVKILCELRRESGITQAELARRLGVDQSLVSKIERRQRRIDIAELRRFCAALGSSLRIVVERFERSLKRVDGGARK